MSKQIPATQLIVSARRGNRCRFDGLPDLTEFCWAKLATALVAHFAQPVDFVLEEQKNP